MEQAKNLKKHPGSLPLRGGPLRGGVRPSAPAGACNCSICTKLGALGGIVIRTAPTLLAGEAQLDGVRVGQQDLDSASSVKNCGVFASARAPRGARRRLRLDQLQHPRRLRARRTCRLDPLGRPPRQLAGRPAEYPVAHLGLGSVLSVLPLLRGIVIAPATPIRRRSCDRPAFADLTPSDWPTSPAEPAERDLRHRDAERLEELLQLLPRRHRDEITLSTVPSAR